MYKFIALFLLTKVFASALTVYVEQISPVASPYYNFYLEATKQTPFDFANSGLDTLVAGETYTFVGLNISSFHPFRMSYTNNGTTTILVNSLYGSNSETFTLDSNVDFSSYVKTYRCAAHSSMSGSFNIANAADPQKLVSFETDVSIVSSNGNKYTLNDNTTYVPKYGLGMGTYTFKNIPESHPMAISNEPNISYVGDVDKKLVDGSGKDYYYGDITVYVSGDFVTASLICLFHGYMGGENMLVFGHEYALSEPPTKTLDIFSSSDLNTWELVKSEIIEAAGENLFLKATLSD